MEDVKCVYVGAPVRDGETYGFANARYLYDDWGEIGVIDSDWGPALIGPFSPAEVAELVAQDRAFLWQDPASVDDYADWG